MQPSLCSCSSGKIPLASTPLFLLVELFFQALHGFKKIKKLNKIITFILIALSIKSYESLFSRGQRCIDTQKAPGFPYWWFLPWVTIVSGHTICQQTCTLKRILCDSHTEYIKLVWFYFTVNSLWGWLMETIYNVSNLKPKIRIIRMKV